MHSTIKKVGEEAGAINQMQNFTRILLFFNNFDFTSKKCSVNGDALS